MIDTKITIRKATEKDIETLTEYRIIFLKETYGVPSSVRESHLRKSLSEYFARSLRDQSFISWIAEFGNRPVGFSGLVIREQPGNFDVPNGRTGYILNMFTLKEFRKKGICNVLFQKLIDESRRLRLDKVELHATNDGERVYRQFGFTEPHDKALELKLLYS